MPSEIVPSDAVRAIQDSVKTDSLMVGDKVYLSRPVHLPPAEPLPDTLILHTLKGFCDFIATKPDGLHIIHVSDFNLVVAHGDIEGRHRERAELAEVKLIGTPDLKFGKWQEIEEFVIWMQVAFVPSALVKEILGIVGNLRDENVKTATDDGITQSVVTRKGVALGQEAQVRNPYQLAPHRTFVEVQQPESSFILRLQQREGKLPLVALFEVGDSKWRLEAIERIAEFIAKKTEDVAIIA